MAKLEICSNDVKESINALKLFRSGWANDIREGWDCSIPGAKELTFELYEISGSIILALEQVLAGNYRDKMAILMTKAKLERLVKSEDFDRLSILNEAGLSHVVTNGTKHHIRVMFECLEVLTA